MSTIDFFPLAPHPQMFIARRLLPYTDYPSKINYTCLLDTAAYHEPCLLVQLYSTTANQPLYSTLHNKHVEFLGCYGFSTTKTRQSNPRFSICLSFPYALTTPVRSTPWASNKDPASVYMSMCDISCVQVPT